MLGGGKIPGTLKRLREIVTAPRQNRKRASTWRPSHGAKVETNGAAQSALHSLNATKTMMSTAFDERSRLERQEANQRAREAGATYDRRIESADNQNEPSDRAKPGSMPSGGSAF